MKNLPDMNFAELFECLPAGFSMVLITGDSSLEFPPGRLKKLSIPFKTHEFVNTVDALLRAAGGGYAPVRYRHRSAVEQQEIDAAKHRLMKARKMTEPEAYRYIQKYSMDAGRSMVESARMVLALMNNNGE
jgi:response regulator NasT